MTQEITSDQRREIFVVTGLGIGEETKSQTVEWLTWLLLSHTILRTGGWQAGHHVVRDDGTEQMFSFFGAGTFEGARTHLKHMVISPTELFQEAVELEDKGIENPFDLITIDKDCLTTTPYHGAMSRFKEIMRTHKKGTVGVGVGDAIRDIQLGNSALIIRASDFLKDSETLTRKVEAIRQHKLHQALDIIHDLQVDELPDQAVNEMRVLQDSTLVEPIVGSMMYLASLVKVVDEEYLDGILAKQGAIVTETSHGALLHPRGGFVPHVTQVDPTAQDLLRTLKERNYTGRVVRLGVSRCYMTRHGAGPLVSYNESMTHSIQETHNAAHEKANEWLGEFRNGNYDVVAMKYALEVSGGRQSFDGLSISYLDVLAQHDQWQVCEAYSYEGDAADLEEFFVMHDGQIVEIKAHPDDGTDAHYQHQLRLTELLNQCRPVLVTLRPTENKKLEDVFLEYVEEKLQLPVVILAYGPKKEDRQVRPGWEHVFKNPRTTSEQKVEKVQLESEVPSSVIVTQPLGVDLYDQEAEAKPRRELNQLLVQIFQRIKDPLMPLDQAIKEELISAGEVGLLYQSLSEFLKGDPHHARLILYLPFQLLPYLSSQGEHTQSALQFTEIYKQCWLRLLHQSEPRANYVDGDILEEGMGDVAMVRKAGHLIPELLERGVIQFFDVQALMEISTDSEISESLAAGVVVARDKGLITDEQWQEIKDRAMIDVATPPLLSVELEDALAEIEDTFAPGSSYLETISPARAKWEKQVRLSQVFDQVAHSYSERVYNQEISIDEVTLLHPVVGIKTIIKVSECWAKKDIQQAQTFAQEHIGKLQHLWQTDDARQKDAILTGLNYWRRLELIEDTHLTPFGVTVPNLAEPFPVDLKTYQETHLRYATEAVQKIASNPELSQYLFPAVIELGSRVKGQAGFDTDFDAGIVFRPETPWEKREEVLDLLRKGVPELNQVEKFIEFWLSQTETGYGLKVAPEKMVTAVSPVQIHLVLNGIWVGCTPELSTIQNDLLKKYKNLSRFGDQEDEVRRQLLYQLELDAVQYRLMHKGFRRFYPSYKSEGTEHADLIDGQSDYWDPMYRRIATQLFISRVFLPSSANSTPQLQR